MRKLTEEELVKRFNQIHVVFEQTPKNHLKGNDCFECSKTKRLKTTSEFVQQANKVHHNFYKVLRQRKQLHL
jgi:hypothetical protein